MKVLITGGSGFIGSALVLFLLKKKYKILNIDDLKYSNNNYLLNKSIKSKNYNFYKVDICDTKKINKVLDNFRPDKIINLAAETHVDKSIDKPDYFIKTNIMGTYNLLKQSYLYFKKLDQLKKKNFLFYQISTDEVYGDISELKSKPKETGFINPSSPYSASKASSDHLVKCWNKTYGLPTIISRCTNNYGPRQHAEKLMPQIILNCLLNRKIKIYGKGNQVRDWLYVDDHVNAIYKIMKFGKVGVIYNIAGNNQIKNIKIANLICDYMDKLKIKKKYKNYRELITFVKDRPGHDKVYGLNTLKLYKELKFKPKYKLKDGIINTVNWFIKNKKHLMSVAKKKNSLKRQGLLD